MLNIIPEKIEYYFHVLKHSMRAEAVHRDGEREISYYFDDKLFSKKTIPNGDFLKDDDIIREYVEEYCKAHIDVYADIFNNHAENVHLTAKTIDAVIENYGINIKVRIREEAERYHVTLSTDNEENVISGQFKASNFSEVLEKLRIFINTLEGVSSELAENIDELSNDKVMELIRWH